jgi:Uma2 family endonuclease
MIVPLPFPATLDDLMQVEGKAELIGGRIVHQMPTGEYPGDIAFTICAALKDYSKRTGFGSAHGENVGYALSEPLTNGRETFSPDASFKGAPRSHSGKYVSGPPLFAVEVRSECDYTGPAAEIAMADKRDDYFEAGTLVVWDVDYRARRITKYSADGSVAVFATGDTADAEPALPGWCLGVDDVFA